MEAIESKRGPESVFKGKTTGAVSELLENNDISKKVPTNKTDLFQPLDKQISINFLNVFYQINIKPGTLIK